jgi:hypothetical protein
MRMESLGTLAVGIEVRNGIMDRDCAAARARRSSGLGAGVVASSAIIR